MIKKLLVANRGEIALRIIRAAQEMGIKTVAVYSKADAESLHRRYADESICIGEAPASKSYLYYQNILGAAEASGADALHPGYGFLAENADFAAACEALGIIFVGPSPESMEKMGGKAAARKLMKESGIPVTPGSDGIIEDLHEGQKIAEQIGYPVMIKAAAGGGGKGMRIVNERRQLEKSLKNAAQEAEKAFGSSELYIEKYIPNARHIEVQILGDKYGNVVHLFERECSIQRSHQKLLEESPSPALNEKMRNKICAAAVKAAKSVNYYSAGTIEFLFDVDTGKFYFMEMNTRIQVEHPITEMVTNIDLVKKQLEVANGDELCLSQRDISHYGHAIECRINAEDWENGFSACPGKINHYIVPGGLGVRVDSACYQGWEILPYYDSLIAKLISWGKDRKEAIARMRRALDEFIIDGVPTTIPFHKKLLQEPEFIKANITTNFIEKYLTNPKEQIDKVESYASSNLENVKS